MSFAGTAIAVFILSCSLMLTAEPLAPEKKQLKLSPDNASTVLPQAQTKTAPTIAVYKAVKSDGTTLFSDRQPLNLPYQVVRFDCFACDPASKVNWHTVPLYTRPFDQFIARAAAEHQLEPALIRAVIHAESSFRPSVVSRKGAVGLMQLMPGTARQLGVSDASVPEHNIAAGSRYLAQLLKQHNGELPLALAAYNAGSSNVRRYNGIPPFAETQAYVERVAILHKRYQRAG
ncbi:soluble lytic murein transglycosylase-like protein [Rheinheimera pacifica]|uniref:lytic transglycosylase domain-containing protein n=1 Tax=Rheinheimera pacifica TaxID=173990 RepID=UPI00216A7B53|nr:lytic transglycosylase domain-containing protein [Rheinheimera pacifica]MCS4308646.1 soluble lytic murein transglycosylase-like protein [Rheinheimera pacifica]